MHHPWYDHDRGEVELDSFYSDLEEECGKEFRINVEEFYGETIREILEEKDSIAGLAQGITERHGRENHDKIFQMFKEDYIETVEKWDSLGISKEESKKGETTLKNRMEQIEEYIDLPDLLSSYEFRKELLEDLKIDSTFTGYKDKFNKAIDQFMAENPNIDTYEDFEKTNRIRYQLRDFVLNSFKAPSTTAVRF
ncbi:MAG: hypothetical protein SVV03_03680 [Candidatus Nanohaloarchaea archaeon]|nr:hypothetical protein [Candidatus Nanohaloarchaea archaeon]